MMNDIMNFDYSYIGQIKEENNAYYVIAQMTSLLNDIDNKVKEMENQKWYQKMVKTVFGKNKATVKEIKDNREKLTSYMAKVIEELYKRQMIDEQAILTIEKQINGIVEDNNELKKKIIILAKKVKTIEKSDLISRNINNKIYNSKSKLLDICIVLSEFNDELLRKQDHLDSIKRDLMINHYISQRKDFFKYVLIKFIEESVNIQEIDHVYFCMLNLSGNNQVARVICNLINQYTFLSPVERKGKKINKLVETILNENDIKTNVRYSTEDLYDDLLKSMKDDISEINGFNIDNHSEDDSIEINNQSSEEEDISGIENNDEEQESEYVSCGCDETKGLTEKTIDAILHIKEDEEEEVNNEVWHINAFIDCKGTLVINNSIIYYNESNIRYGITLSEGAKIFVRNSTVICKGYEKSYFINCEGKNEVLFENSMFFDCTYFIKDDYEKSNSFIMTNCSLMNCFNYFIKIRSFKLVDIHDNVIIWEKLNEKYKTEKVESAIEISGYGDRIIKFYNNAFNESENYLGNDEEYKDYGWEKINIKGDNSCVSNCTFLGVVNAIRNSKRITECRFVDCYRCINLGDEYESNNIIDNCIFEKCTYVIKTSDNMCISNSKFVSCYDNLIFPGQYNGGVKIEYCDFVNISNLKKYEEWGRANSCIAFRRSSGGNTSQNTMKKCIFDGVEIGDNFLISAHGYEKPKDTVTRIEECVFRNCSTKRESGKIIKEYLRYETLFKKERDFHANNIIDCKGLDMVNKENNKSSNYIINEKTSTGEIIGAYVQYQKTKFKVGNIVLSSLAYGPIGTIEAIQINKHFDKLYDGIKEQITDNKFADE